MAQKHLHELLKEDQEPFLLKNYISNKRTQLKRTTTSPKTTLQLKKQNSNLCKNACFLSLQTKSPLFDLTTSVSPPKTPNRSSNPAIFLNIPAKTASLLLDAALRIHKHSKTNKNNLFGSFFKRITQRGRNRKSHEETEESVSLSVKDILKWESSNIRKRRRNKSKREEDYNGREEDCNGRTSSAVWSESNEEDKSLDMETSSSSGHSCEEEELPFVDKKKEKTDCSCFDDHGFFCESPFHFVLQRSPSSASGHRTPELSSPPASPSRHRTQDKENNGGDGVNKFQSEEEDKEQNSPVSVLDPPFDDVNENDDEEETSGFDLECSYANVQRTKQQLLDRLRRFEQLAELDPVELERRMLEDNEDETFMEEDVDYEEKALREIVFEVMCHSRVRDKRQDPEDLKRLVYDLIREEDKEVEYFSEDRKNVMMRRVCKRLELWNEVESKTIDMMIEEDLSREESGRKKKNGEETREVACEIEVAIFCFLVEEFSEELLVC